MLAAPGPVLVDVHVARFDNVYPMVPGGAAHTEMLFGPDDIAAPCLKRPARCSEPPLPKRPRS